MVKVRTGIVQSPAGGTLRLLRPLFSAGLGGRLGTGRQWFSWIGIDDLVDVYHRALWDSGLSGPVNAVSAEPVRNVDYTRSWLTSCIGLRCCRCRRWGRRCCSASRVRANSPWPTSGCCPRDYNTSITGFAAPTWSRRCDICWVVVRTRRYSPRGAARTAATACGSPSYST